MLSKIVSVLSGVQPTGSIHIGNYLGALKQFPKFIADSSDSLSLFFIADLHAITCGVPIKNLQDNVMFTLATYLSIGLSHENCTIFLQSHVAQHSELAWLFSCITPMGMLNRMTQFKSKSEKMGEMLGLFSYPVLMAADILLYNPEKVPVGEDQLQHLELTREIADKFNFLTGKEVFNRPNAILQKECARVMSLRNPEQKMSKSDESHMSRIELTDSDDDIVKKISSATTDSKFIENFDVMKNENRHGALNLLSILSAVRGCDDVVTLCEGYIGSGFAKLKADLADAVIEEINPIRRRIYEYLSEKTYLQKILHDNAEIVRAIAHDRMKLIHEAFLLL